MEDAYTLGLRAILSCLKVQENLFDQGNASREERILHSQESFLLQLWSFSMSFCAKNNNIPWLPGREISY